MKKKAASKGAAVKVRELDAELTLDMMLEDESAKAKAPPKPAKIFGVAIGVLVGFDPKGVPLVNHPDNTTGSGLRARATTALEKGHVGSEVALMFEAGNPEKPIVMGLMHQPQVRTVTSKGQRITPKQDGKTALFEAEDEIVLRCGRASITLTREGKVLIRGAYLSSRSTGVNRILGGSVQIN